MDLGRSHTKWSQPDRDNSIWVHTLLSSSILGKMKKQIQGTNLQDKKRLWDFQHKVSQKNKWVKALISFHPLCRNSVPLIDTPQGPEDHHTELCLSLCNILYGKRTEKTTDVPSAYVTTDSGGCTLPTSTKQKIIPAQHPMRWKKRNYWFIPCHLLNLGW